MSVRYASEADIADCVQMGIRFARAANQRADTDSIEQTIRQLVSNETLLVAGSPAVGMLGVLVYQNYMHRSEWLAQEVFWWVEPEARSTRVGVSLLQEAEALAKDRGASRLMMLCLDDLDGDRVANLYRRRGYVPQEQTFVRHL